MFKKGAMFGLDARIALVIFGALSVISGAALFSAIENAKFTAAATQASEIEKAFESYYLDTGSYPTNIHSDASFNFYSMKDLVTDPGVSGWKGPYISGDLEDISIQWDDKIGGAVRVNDLLYNIGSCSGATFTLCVNVINIDFKMCNAMDQGNYSNIEACGNHAMYSGTLYTMSILTGMKSKL
jgi:type II secretory pathway pseudopilin PulG